MYRLLFRTVALAGALVWVALLVQFLYLRLNYASATSIGQENVAAQPTPTQVPFPKIEPPTLEALPDTVAAGQGGAELPASANTPLGIHPKTGRYVAAWLPTSFDAEAARATFEANKDVLDEVSPFWYGVMSDGRIAADTGSRDSELVRIARENNVLIIPTIHNIGDAEAASVVISDPGLRARHIQIIMEEVRTYEYDGIDIDYESLTLDMEDEFTAFMTELSQALHAEGKLLTVAVHAHTGRPDYQNYKALGEVVDRFRIMTYDYSWSGSEPGPIAPLFWVRDVAEYAMTVVDPKKIQIGICFYAYDWPNTGARADALTFTQVEEIKSAFQPSVNFVEERGGELVQESFFNYAGRTVWFANDKSLQSRMELVREMDLAGIAIWRLGNEDPKNWSYIRESFQTDPVIIQRTINGYLPEH